MESAPSNASLTENKGSWRRRISRFAAITFLGVWAAGSITVGASLMVGHWYTLPRPATDEPTLLHALDDLRGTDRQRWLAVHVLYSECRCSQRILDHIVDSKRPADVAERVVLVGANPQLERRMADAGFQVAVVSPGELKRRFRIESAPLLLVADPSGSVRYGGGYTDRKQGPAIKDLEIIAALTSGHASNELPVFGCGVSRDLQALLDPVGLKYDWGEAK